MLDCFKRHPITVNVEVVIHTADNKAVSIPITNHNGTSKAELCDGDTLRIDLDADLSFAGRCR